MTAHYLTTTKKSGAIEKLGYDWFRDIIKVCGFLSPHFLLFQFYIAICAPNKTDGRKYINF